MQKYALIFTLIMPIASSSSPLSAQPMSPCEALAFQWDNIEKDLAVTEADGVADNSVPRETVRKLEKIDLITRANLIYLMMRDQKCELPYILPVSASYLSAALRCDRVRRQQQNPNVRECDQTEWKQMGEE